MTEHFQREYIDDLTAIDPAANFFTGVWDEIFAAGHRPKALLDVGCGTGVFSMYAQQQTNCAVSGVDGSEYALAQAKQLGFTNTLAIGDFNTDKLPFADGSFDFVLCKDVLEHLLNPLHLVRESRRVLKDGGLLLLHVPNHFPLSGRLKFLLTNELDTFGFFPGTNRWEFPHLRFYEHREFVSIAEGIGFTRAGDFSHCFASVPVLNRIPGTARLQRLFARHSPSQFASGFTVLFRKIA
jgi:SAM-dependent methyltransferase